MSQAFFNLNYHLVFSTKDRRPIITPEHQPRLYEYIGGIIRGVGGTSIIINSIEDHVHILTKLRPDKSLSDVIRDLKSNATGWMHDIFPEAKDFAWQRGYGAFTVSASQIDRVKNYILKQESHHQKHSFQEEFVEMLRVNEIEFDERYLWKG
jgi:putative transposase